MIPNPNYTAIVIVGIVFGTIGFITSTGIVIGILTRHWRLLEARRLGNELIREMLQRKMQPDEIERILVAWSEEPALAKKVLPKHAKETLDPKWNG